MKLRKFYPSQVIRRLNGKDFDSVDAVNQRALSIALRRSRRSALSINIVEGRIDVRNAADLGRMMLQDFKRDLEIASKLDYSRFFSGKKVN